MMPLYDKMGPLFRKLEPTNPLSLRQPYLYPSLHDFYYFSNRITVPIYTLQFNY